MIEVIERLGGGFPFVRAGADRVAEAVALPHLPRHRFSRDKKPLKTHAAAVFRTRELPRPQGAGLYFEIAPRLGVDRRRHVACPNRRNW